MKLLQGDTLEQMAILPDCSVDMILCDLPYGTTACKWDTVIPFEPLWEQYKRLIKKNGAIVLFGSQPFTSALVMSNVEGFKYDWVWRKPKGTGHLNAKHQPMRDKEDVLVFCGARSTYNPQFTTGEPFGDKRGSNAGVYGKHDPVNYANDGKRYPKQVIEFGVVERATVHPTQKPVALCEYLIRTYTNEGETVLDNTMGSGTTGVACVNTGRHFIGIERDDKYFEIARQRIDMALNPTQESFL